ncbi:TPA: hypothetical protein EYN98_05575 [Candidatus Poribacteria bacterium]|jgi:hypothetical protein|nr:hypothetical protein [Candidatus Poribacteria bacterium]HIA65525.1 hypothetical protein [Candidatus Poribacteria bacterium]HIB88338.1 hypothetical protein [Candidatus Poribacteria bacterium]HIC02558.1 hypothetical protein [Candidatus Poribacteria bacterium]HIO78359.1 hypothetical protein [Candidatus Poribacteria bacterium]
MMKSSPIQELDPNSNKIDPETGLRWYDIQMFGVEGQGWADTQRPYAQLPAKAEALVHQPVWQISSTCGWSLPAHHRTPSASNAAFAIAAHGCGRARRRVPVREYRRIR